MRQPNQITHIDLLKSSFMFGLCMQSPFAHERMTGAGVHRSDLTRGSFILNG
jgi:hypothetical protein